MTRRAVLAAIVAALAAAPAADANARPDAAAQRLSGLLRAMACSTDTAGRTTCTYLYPAWVRAADRGARRLP